MNCDSIGQATVDSVALSIKDAPEEHCGQLLGSGQHVDCYSLAADNRFVVKILRKNTLNVDWTVARRRRAYGLSKGLAEQDVCPTCCNLVGPNRFGFFEVQERIEETAFDLCARHLEAGEIDQAQEVIGKVWCFEQNRLWRRGLLIQDTRSYLRNIAFRGDQPILFDFCSLESNYRMGLLFFEGPWRVYRLIGTLKEFASRISVHESLTEFFRWYQIEGIEQYSRAIYERLWQLDI